MTEHKSIKGESKVGKTGGLSSIGSIKDLYNE